MQTRMGLGLGLGMTRGGGGGVYSPASALFGAGEQGVWYDFSDLSTMFQDTAGTTPVTAVGQRIARINDKSGNGNHGTRATTAQQPILRQTGGGLYYAEFDGIDDSWVTGNINFSTTDEMTVIAGVRKLSDAAIGVIAQLSANSVTNDGAFGLWNGSASSGSSTYTAQSRGSVSASATPIAGTATSPITNVLTLLADISADSIDLRIDGVSRATSAADQGTGSYAAAQPLFVGRRGGATLPLNGHLFGLIVRGKATSGDTLTDAETYMAGETGATL